MHVVVLASSLKCNIEQFSSVECATDHEDTGSLLHLGMTFLAHNIKKVVFYPTFNKTPEAN